MGISGYLAYDLKRIIAYSTSAQMSFIIIKCWNSNIFILLTTINLIGLNYSLIYISKEMILDILLLLHLVYIKYILLLASIMTISYSIKLLLIIH